MNNHAACSNKEGDDGRSARCLNGRGSLNDLADKANVLHPDDKVKEEQRRTTVTQIQTGERQRWFFPSRISFNYAARSSVDNIDPTFYSVLAKNPSLALCGAQGFKNTHCCVAAHVGLQSFSV